MSSIEFSTRLRSGIIRIPGYVEKKLKGKNVHISINWENEEKRNFDIDQIEPIVHLMKQKRVFETLKDPAQWQKRLRDEWE